MEINFLVLLVSSINGVSFDHTLRSEIEINNIYSKLENMFSNNKVPIEGIKEVSIF